MCWSDSRTKWDIQGNPKVFRSSLIGIVEDKKLVRTWGIQRDVTAKAMAEEGKRKAELSLASSEERFRVALKDSPITWIYNPQAYWQHEAIGKTDAEIIGARKAASLLELKRRVLKTGVALRQEVVIPHNGKHYAFDITVEPLLDASGDVVGITGTTMDIAQLREMTDRLQDARDRLAQEKLYRKGRFKLSLGSKKSLDRVRRYSRY
jgi:PAS domain-containing protein